jgi:hypothetical protein
VVTANQIGAILTRNGDLRNALGLACSLLAGFGMAVGTARSWIHMVSFALTLAVALYIVTDMEYPRLGLIRIEAFIFSSTVTMPSAEQGTPQGPGASTFFQV